MYWPLLNMYSENFGFGLGGVIIGRTFDNRMKGLIYSVYTCVYIYTYTYIYTYMQVLFVCICIYTYIYLYAHMCILSPLTIALVKNPTSPHTMDLVSKKDPSQLQAARAARAHEQVSEGRRERKREWPGTVTQTPRGS